MTFEDLEFETREVGGIQAKVFFGNGYGASVIRGYGSYGYEDGLYELAVLKCLYNTPSFKDGDYYICYDSGLTSDVQGYLSPEAVTTLLNQIEAL